MTLLTTTQKENPIVCFAAAKMRGSFGSAKLISFLKKKKKKASKVDTAKRTCAAKSAHMPFTELCKCALCGDTENFAPAILES